MRRLVRLCVGNKEHYVVMTPSPCRYLFFYKDHFLQVHTAPCRCVARTYVRARVGDIGESVACVVGASMMDSSRPTI